MATVMSFISYTSHSFGTHKPIWWKSINSLTIQLVCLKPFQLSTYNCCQSKRQGNERKNIPEVNPFTPQRNMGGGVCINCITRPMSNIGLRYRNKVKCSCKHWNFNEVLQTSKFICGTYRSFLLFFCLFKLHEWMAFGCWRANTSTTTSVLEFN